jgi:hypothetical protein
VEKIEKIHSKRVEKMCRLSKQTEIMRISSEIDSLHQKIKKHENLKIIGDQKIMRMEKEIETEVKTTLETSGKDAETPLVSSVFFRKKTLP